MAGEELGKVDDLLIDEREQKVRFLEVTSGGFLGLGATKFLLPVDAITRLTDDSVYINQSRESVAGAPRYDPTLVEERYVRMCIATMGILHTGAQTTFTRPIRIIHHLPVPVTRSKRALFTSRGRLYQNVH